MLSIQNLSMRYPSAPFDAVQDVSFEVEKGKKLAIVGESGSGKTTLLKLLSGLLDPSSGTIMFNEKLILGPAFNLVPGNEYIRMVLQDYGLKKNQTIKENLQYPLRYFSKEEQDIKIAALAKVLHIENLLDRMPYQLSGGQQQRASIASCMASTPEVMLMDEPFSNLDVLLADQIRLYMMKEIKRTKNSLIFVTHQTADALALADSILVMRHGKIVQHGTVEEIYDQPVSPYVAALFSDMNFFRFDKLEEIKLKGYKHCEKELGSAFVAGIRTHDIEVFTKGKGLTKATVIRKEFCGDQYKLFLRLPNKLQLKAYTKDISVQQGDVVKLTFGFDDLLLFPNQTSLDV
ncbi:MAG: ABC transporter ATP-binding protein [Cytophagales bacterium]|nr:ABC transporter ATP-binding protein [Cytophaga sp.]